MKLSKFKEIITQLKKVSDRHRLLHKADVELINYDTPYWVVINTLLKEVFTKESCDWIDWFMYERDFGRDKEMRAFDGDKQICKDIEGLYELLEFKK